MVELARHTFHIDSQSEARPLPRMLGISIELVGSPEADVLAHNDIIVCVCSSLL